MKESVSEMGKLIHTQLQWQASFEAKIDAISEDIKEATQTQRDMKRCLNDIKVELARNYVTKKEFETYCTESEERIIRIHSRLDEIGRYQRDSLWKIILYFVPIAALVFTIFTWIFGELG